MDAKRSRPVDATRADGPPVDAETVVEGGAVVRREPEGPSGDDLEPGARLGRYILLEPVGRGGMGVVWSAYDPELDRKVALKLLRADAYDSASHDARSRLLREAQAMARLSHPNVIAVYDVGTLSGRRLPQESTDEADRVSDELVFVAMEFVDGSTLSTWLRDSSRNWRDVLDIHIRAGRGLASAHKAGLVHRDFKPDNVLVGHDGRVRVMDFGLAVPQGEAIAKHPDEREPKSESGDVRLTETGVIMGTPAYMAPEQHLGEAIDARSDQFSFCVALYQALYDDRPFFGDTSEELSKQKLAGRVKDAPPGNRVPSWVRRVILRGLAAERDQRWEAMETLLEQLGRDPVAARRRFLGAAGSVALLGAGIASVGHLYAQRNSVCDATEELMAGTWDEQRKASVRAAILDTGVGHAQDAWLGVERWMDAYARRWLDMRSDACEATHIRGEQSRELLATREDCLDLRLTEAQAVLEVLAEADITTVTRAVDAVAGLEPIGRCADVELLSSRAALPSTSEGRDALAEVRGQLARARAHEAFGRYADGKAIAEQAVIAATAVDYSPIVALARYQLGRLQRLTEDREPAVENLSEAALIAAGVRHDELAAMAAIELVDVVGVGQGRYEHGRLWGRHAEAAVRRIGAGGVEEADLLINVAKLSMAEGDPARAREHLERAIALQERLFGAEHPRVAQTAVALARATRTHAEDADALLTRAIELTTAALGASHPYVGELSKLSDS